MTKGIYPLVVAFTRASCVDALKLGYSGIKVGVTFSVPTRAMSLYDLRQAQAAGRATVECNASHNAFDYKAAKLDFGRSFLMDDYVESGRTVRRMDLPGPVAHMRNDACWEAIKNPDQTTFVAKQGFSETKFHNGFMRRQGMSIPYLQERSSKPPPTEEAFERPGRRMMPHGPSHNVLTGEGVDKLARHPERRHIRDAEPIRAAGMYADAPGGRLRDSSSRFFCTPDQMPRRQGRQQNIEADGLTSTKRTSTVIGVGSNPSQEIFSIGAREALSDSLYGLQRRMATKAAPTISRAPAMSKEAQAVAADVAMVKALA